MQVKIKVFIKIVIIRTERDEMILSDHLFFEKRAIRYGGRKSRRQGKSVQDALLRGHRRCGHILCGACFSRADRNILFDGIVYNISFAYDIYEYFL